VKGFGCRYVTSCVRFAGFVYKKFLSGDIAICEFIINLKVVSVDFIAKLVKSTYA